MYKLFCSVCVKNASDLIEINSQPQGINTIDILKIAIPEIKWDEKWLICSECTFKIHEIQEFRSKCINNENLRKTIYNFTIASCDTAPIVKDAGDNLSNNIVKSKNYNLIENTAPLKKLTKVRINKRSLRQTKIYKCDKCENTFNTSSNLLQHKLYHSGIRTKICSYCGKGFVSKSDLNVHEKQHLNKREYKCDVCTKTFNTNQNLRSHKLVVHTNPLAWNHVCQICNKRFPIKSNLDQHIRRHTGDKRFTCHLCEKRFTDKVVLQKHIKSHSNYRAFKCEYCDKEYKDKRVLEIHLKKVHSVGNAKVPIKEKKYFCQLCPKAYFAKNKLTRHMCSHTGEKPYFCEFCQKKFTDNSYVKQHLKTVHGVVCKFD